MDGFVVSALALILAESKQYTRMYSRVLLKLAAAVALNNGDGCGGPGSVHTFCCYHFAFFLFCS